jgi:hypothetical protein
MARMPGDARVERVPPHEEIDDVKDDANSG